MYGQRLCLQKPSECNQTTHLAHIAPARSNERQHDTDESQYDLSALLLQQIGMILQELGRDPTPEETAERASLSLEDTRCILKMTRQPLSLDQPVGDHDDSFFGEFLEDGREEDPLYETNQQALKDQIEIAMRDLNHREREILRLRYGLTDGYAYTLEEVGKIFSVTRERVRQIESKDDFKSHAIHLEGHKSPDRADALFMCFYEENHRGSVGKMHDMVGG